MNVMEAVQNTDLVVEAVVENINVKHKLFSSIDPVRTFLPYVFNNSIFCCKLICLG
jgi:hypothetical protein